MGGSQSLVSPEPTETPHLDGPRAQGKGIAAGDSAPAGNGGNAGRQRAVPSSRSDRLPRKKQVTFGVAPEPVRASKSVEHRAEADDPLVTANDDGDALLAASTLAHSHNRLWDIAMTPDTTPQQQQQRRERERVLRAESRFSSAQTVDRERDGRGIDASASAANTSSTHSVGHAEGSFLSFFGPRRAGMAGSIDGSDGGGVDGGASVGGRGIGARGDGSVDGSSAGGGGGNHHGMELTPLPSDSPSAAQSNRSNGLTEASLCRRTAVGGGMVGAGAVVAAGATAALESGGRGEGEDEAGELSASATRLMPGCITVASLLHTCSRMTDNRAVMACRCCFASPTSLPSFLLSSVPD